MEIDFVNNFTGNKTTLETTVDANGGWGVEIPGLLNGGYSVVAKAKDRFNNYYSSIALNITLDVDLGGDRITGAVLRINDDTLQRGESTKLHLTTYVTDKQIDNQYQHEADNGV